MDESSDPLPPLVNATILSVQRPLTYNECELCRGFGTFDCRVGGFPRSWDGKRVEKELLQFGKVKWVPKYRGSSSVLLRMDIRAFEALCEKPRLKIEDGKTYCTLSIDPPAVSKKPVPGQPPVFCKKCFQLCRQQPRFRLEMTVSSFFSVFSLVAFDKVAASFLGIDAASFAKRAGRPGWVDEVVRALEGAVCDFTLGERKATARYSSQKVTALRVADTEVAEKVHSLML